MPEASAKFTRRHKLLLASLATVSLSLGAAGVVSASQNQSAPTGGNPSSEEVKGTESEADEVDGVEGTESEADEVDGVNCEDGLVDGVAVVDGGTECDGGPAANATDEESEGTEGGTPEDTETAG